MANKKISELAVRTPSLTDLMLVGDPSTGYSYKATISSLSTLLEANIALDDLNDVTITSPTAGQVLSYNGTAWVNDTNGVTGSGTSGQVAYWTGTSSQSGSANFTFDGNRVGIARTPSARRLEIQQAVGSTASAISLFDGGSTIRGVLGIESNVTNDIQIASNAGIRFYSGSTIGNIVTDPTNERMRLFSSTGNLLIQNGGTFTDGGQRLQVNGDVLFKGSGNTSATTALTVQNSDGTNMFRVRSDNNILIGSANAAISTGNALTTNESNGGILYFAPPSTFDNTGKIGVGIAILSRASTASTAVNSQILQIAEAGAGYAPTSGSLTRTYFQINATINQTGGANGITRGLYVNPTLTAAADWRSIEWSNNSGWGLYGAGSAYNYLQGNLSIGTTTTTGSYAVRANGSIYAQSNLRFDSQLRDNRDNGIISQSASGVTSNRVLTIANGTYLSLVVDNANLLLGSATDTGQKLQVTGQAIISSTSSRQLVVSYPGGAEMRLTASATANNFTILDVNGYGLTHGTSWSGINASQSIIRLWTQATNTTTLSLGGQDLNPTVARTRTIIEPVASSSTLFSPTSGNAIDYQFRTTGNSRFSPTSGNATYTFMSIVPEYNTTGTYSGTITGFIYNPTLTSLTGATHIAIQTVSGDVLFGTTSGSVGVGTSTINASAILQADSTIKGFLPPRMTNAQMVAIATPAAGLVVYDTTNNKLNVYDGTNWVTLH